MPKRYIVGLATPFEGEGADNFATWEGEAESAFEARRLAEASHPDHIGYEVVEAA